MYTGIAAAGTPAPDGMSELDHRLADIREQARMNVERHEQTVAADLAAVDSVRHLDAIAASLSVLEAADKKNADRTKVLILIGALTLAAAVATLIATLVLR